MQDVPQHSILDQDLARAEIRRLWPSDRPEILGHFLRLDAENRRLRFGAPMSDDAVARHVREVMKGPARLYGAYADGRLRAVAELCLIETTTPPTAEAAFSVEPDYQNHGIGDRLLQRAITAACAWGVTRVLLVCLRENDRMLRLARNHAARLEMDADIVAASLTTPRLTRRARWRDRASDILGRIRLAFRAVPGSMPPLPPSYG